MGRVSSHEVNRKRDLFISTRSIHRISVFYGKSLCTYFKLKNLALRLYFIKRFSLAFAIFSKIAWSQTSDLFELIT